MDKKIFAAVLSAAILMMSAVAIFAKNITAEEKATTVQLPLVQCWYNGQVAYYIQTEASDPDLAAQQNVNYVARLANAANSDAVDDIYHVTNFTQGNVIPSAPIPAGPDNADPDYTPLWQVSLVTWNQGTTPHILKSESEIQAARTAGLIMITKTDIIVNCPVIFTPDGGLLPTAKITSSNGNRD